MTRIPHTVKLEGGLEAHYYTTPETFQDKVLRDAISGFAELGSVESPLVVLPDVLHQAEGISPSGMTLATRGAIVPAAVPAANGSGVRVAALDLEEKDVGPDRLARFLELLAARVPVHGEDSPSLLRGRLREDDLIGIYRAGAKWIAAREGLDESFERIESEGAISIEASSSAELRRWIPDYFFEQGLYGFGIIEPGNHFIAVQIVDEILDPDRAASAGIEAGQALLMIHDGSPASLAGQYFHPVPYAGPRETDRFEADKRAYHARFLPAEDLEGTGSVAVEEDRCFSPASPFYAIEQGSETHRRFLGLMGMACNFGFANRIHLQEVVTRSLGVVLGHEDLRSRTLTDTLHDCVKPVEIDGQRAMVHRSGASEARPASSYASDHPFARTGQLVGVAGAPGHASLLAAAGDTTRTWYTANHGVGGGIGESIAEANEVVSLAEEGGLLHGIARLRPISTY